MEDTKQEKQNKSEQEINSALNSQSEIPSQNSAYNAINLDANLEPSFSSMLFQADLERYQNITDTIEAMFESTPLSILQYINNTMSDSNYWGDILILISFALSVMTIIFYLVSLVVLLFQNDAIMLKTWRDQLDEQISLRGFSKFSDRKADSTINISRDKKNQKQKLIKNQVMYDRVKLASDQKKNIIIKDLTEHTADSFISQLYPLPSKLTVKHIDQLLKLQICKMRAILPLSQQESQKQVLDQKQYKLNLDSHVYEEVEINFSKCNMGYQQFRKLIQINARKLCLNFSQNGAILYTNTVLLIQRQQKPKNERNQLEFTDVVNTNAQNQEEFENISINESVVELQLILKQCNLSQSSMDNLTNCIKNSKNLEILDLNISNNNINDISHIFTISKYAQQNNNYKGLTQVIIDISHNNQQNPQKGFYQLYNSMITNCKDLTMIKFDFSHNFLELNDIQLTDFENKFASFIEVHNAQSEMDSVAQEKDDNEENYQYDSYNEDQYNQQLKKTQKEITIDIMKVQEMGMNKQAYHDIPQILQNLPQITEQDLENDSNMMNSPNYQKINLSQSQSENKNNESENNKNNLGVSIKNKSSFSNNLKPPSPVKNVELQYLSIKQEANSNQQLIEQENKDIESQEILGKSYNYELFSQRYGDKLIEIHFNFSYNKLNDNFLTFLFNKILKYQKNLQKLTLNFNNQQQSKTFTINGIRSFFVNLMTLENIEQIHVDFTKNRNLLNYYIGNEVLNYSIRGSMKIQDYLNNYLSYALLPQNCIKLTVVDTTPDDVNQQMVGFQKGESFWIYFEEGIILRQPSKDLSKFKNVVLIGREDDQIPVKQGIQFHKNDFSVSRTQAQILYNLDNEGNYYIQDLGLNNCTFQLMPKVQYSIFTGSEVILGRPFLSGFVKLYIYILDINYNEESVENDDVIEKIIPQKDQQGQVVKWLKRHNRKQNKTYFENKNKYDYQSNNLNSNNISNNNMMNASHKHKQKQYHQMNLSKQKVSPQQMGMSRSRQPRSKKPSGDMNNSKRRNEPASLYTSPAKKPVINFNSQERNIQYSQGLNSSRQVRSSNKKTTIQDYNFYVNQINMNLSQNNNLLGLNKVECPMLTSSKQNKSLSNMQQDQNENALVNIPKPQPTPRAYKQIEQNQDQNLKSNSNQSKKKKQQQQNWENKSEIYMSDDNLGDIQEEESEEFKGGAQILQENQNQNQSISISQQMEQSSESSIQDPFELQNQILSPKRKKENDLTFFHRESQKQQEELNVSIPQEQSFIQTKNQMVNQYLNQEIEEQSHKPQSVVYTDVSEQIEFTESRLLGYQSIKFDKNQQKIQQNYPNIGKQESQKQCVEIESQYRIAQSDSSKQYQNYQDEGVQSGYLPKSLIKSEKLQKQKEDEQLKTQFSVDETRRNLLEKQETLQSKLSDNYNNIQLLTEVQQEEVNNNYNTHLNKEANQVKKDSQQYQQQEFNQKISDFQPQNQDQNFSSNQNLNIQSSSSKVFKKLISNTLPVRKSGDFSSNFEFGDQSQEQFKRGLNQQDSKDFSISGYIRQESQQKRKNIDENDPKRLRTKGTQDFNLQFLYEEQINDDEEGDESPSEQKDKYQYEDKIIEKKEINKESFMTNSQLIKNFKRQHQQLLDSFTPITNQKDKSSFNNKISQEDEQNKGNLPQTNQSYNVNYNISIIAQVGRQFKQFSFNIKEGDSIKVGTNPDCDLSIHESKQFIEQVQDEHCSIGRNVYGNWYVKVNDKDENNKTYLKMKNRAYPTQKMIYKLSDNMLVNMGLTTFKVSVNNIE